MKDAASTISMHAPFSHAVFDFQIINVQPTKHAKRESSLLQHPSAFRRRFTRLVCSTEHSCPKKINTNKNKAEQREERIGTERKTKKEVG